ncbi:MAG: ABC transporter ATP-binding protein [Sandarakinorhabdus sp.]|nr:ABC transporter ATP-binding protein [Sandarakinorhabdus sp.]
MTPILALDSLSVALPPGADRQLAVADLTFSVRRGETLCIIGASGSGKSVLASAMMGSLAPGLRVTAGNVTLGGTRLTGLPEPALRQLRGNRIALIPQEPVAALNPLTTIGKQVAEVFEIHGGATPDRLTSRVTELLESVALHPALAQRYPYQLSGGECQRVAIAVAIAMAPDVLIADEATTALDTVTQAQIIALLAQIKRRTPHGLVFISHDIGVVGQIADRIAVIDQGRIVEIGSARDVLDTPQHSVTRAMIAATRPRMARSLRQATAPRLVINGLDKNYGARVAVADINLSLGAGQTLAIVGASGSGKSSLARMIVQLITPDRGLITVDGIDLPHVPRGTVQMVFQDSWGALNPRRSVGAGIARAAELAGADRPVARAHAHELLALVGLSPDAFDRYPSAFSGGQRQRIAIARALAMRPRVLICDESVSGLDPLAQRQILSLLEDLQKRSGFAMLFITHDLRTAAAIADQIIVMARGRIVEGGEAVGVLTSPQSNAAKTLVAAMSGA